MILNGLILIVAQGNLAPEMTNFATELMNYAPESTNFASGANNYVFEWTSFGFQLR